MQDRARPCNLQDPCPLPAYSRADVLRQSVDRLGDRRRRIINACVCYVCALARACVCVYLPLSRYYRTFARVCARVRAYSVAIVAVVYTRA